MNVTIRQHMNILMEDNGQFTIVKTIEDEAYDIWEHVVVRNAELVDTSLRQKTFQPSEDSPPMIYLKGEAQGYYRAFTILNCGKCGSGFVVDHSVIDASDREFDYIKGFLQNRFGHMCSQ